MERDFKLYELVWVSEPTAYATCGVVGYVGQVLSRRTPDDTYMVRRVPGHPGTLVELHASTLSVLERGTVATDVSYSIVAGRGQFPVDMLRYDNCQPVNFRIVDSIVGPKAVMLPGYAGDQMIVAKACRAGRALWTPERWQSFLWSQREFAVVPIGFE